MLVVCVFVISHYNCTSCSPSVYCSVFTQSVKPTDTTMSLIPLYKCWHKREAITKCQIDVFLCCIFTFAEWPFNWFLSCRSGDTQSDSTPRQRQQLWQRISAGGSAVCLGTSCHTASNDPTVVKVQEAGQSHYISGGQLVLWTEKGYVMCQHNHNWISP